jgi:hypothetical protein
LIANRDTIDNGNLCISCSSKAQGFTCDNRRTTGDRHRIDAIFEHRMFSGGGNIFARYALGIPVHDCTAGYRLYRCRLLESIDLDSVQSQGYSFQIEMTYREAQQGFKMVETPSCQDQEDVLMKMVTSQLTLLA